MIATLFVIPFGWFAALPTTTTTATETAVLASSQSLSRAAAVAFRVCARSVQKEDWADASAF